MCMEVESVAFGMSSSTLPPVSASRPMTVEIIEHDIPESRLEGAISVIAGFDATGLDFALIFVSRKWYYLTTSR